MPRTAPQRRRVGRGAGRGADAAREQVREAANKERLRGHVAAILAGAGKREASFFRGQVLRFADEPQTTRREPDAIAL